VLEDDFSYLLWSFLGSMLNLGSFGFLVKSPVNR